MVAVLNLAHQGTTTVLLASVDDATGTKLARVLDVPLVQIVTVGVGDVTHGDGGSPDRVWVAAGVVVLGHAPTGNLAVGLGQLLHGVVLLGHAGRQHVVTEPDQALVTVGLEHDQGNVVTTVTSVIPERVKEVVLNDPFDPKGLLVGVGTEDEVVSDPGEPGLDAHVVGEAVGGSQEEVGGQDGGGAHEQGLARAEEDKEAGHPGEGAPGGGYRAHGGRVMTPNDPALSSSRYSGSMDREVRHVIGCPPATHAIILGADESTNDEKTNEFTNLFFNRLPVPPSPGEATDVTRSWRGRSGRSGGEGGGRIEQSLPVLLNRVDPSGHLFSELSLARLDCCQHQQGAAQK